MLKKITFLAVIALLVQFSCQSIDEIDYLSKNYNFIVSTIELNQKGISARDSETACASVELVAGQHFNAGRVDVEVVNEEGENFVYISYLSANDWVIKLTHLYAGDKEGIPETKKGNPKPGVFEKKMDYEANVISDFEVEYKIPAAAFENCFSIAAHAEVAKIDENGNVIQQETAWAKGDSFEGNSWAMLFDFCKTECESFEEDEGGIK